MSKDEYRIVRLPYGQWTCADGRRVLFNRGYQPICQRLNDVVTTCENHWVDDIIDTCYFYDDGWRRSSTLPRLIEKLESLLSAFRLGDNISV